MSDLVTAAATALIAAAAATLFTDARPPARFHDDVVFMLDVRDQAGIDAACHPRFGVPPRGMKTDACTLDGRVVAPNPCAFSQSERYARMICHEMAHVNGWPATHGE